MVGSSELIVLGPERWVVWEGTGVFTPADIDVEKALSADPVTITSAPDC